MIAVVVVNFNSHDLIAAQCQSAAWADHDVKIVVVDNFHSDQARQAITDVAQQHDCQLVPLPTNAGFGAGVNAGAAWALEHDADVIITINPDVTITVHAIQELAKHVREHPDQLASIHILRSDGQTWFRGAMLDMVDGTTSSGNKKRGVKHLGTPWVTGAVLACNADFWATLGGFDEDYFMYWEDIDLSYRAWRAGGSVAVLDHVTAVHDPGGTQQTPTSGTKSPLYIKYNCRNRLLFASKHLSPALVKMWRTSARAYATEVVLRSGSKKYLAHPPSVRAAVAGTMEGLRAAAKAIAS